MERVANRVTKDTKDTKVIKVTKVIKDTKVIKVTKVIKDTKGMMELGIKDTKENLLNAINAMDAVTQIDIFTEPSLTPNHIVTRIVEIIH